MKFSGWYSLIGGISMVAQWAFFLLTGQVPELETEPYRIAFHLAGEALTALALIISGIALLRRAAWGRMANSFALGMLTYTAIVSPGYFAQQGAWPLVGMFGIILIFTSISLCLLWRFKNIGACPALQNNTEKHT